MKAALAPFGIKMPAVAKRAQKEGGNVRAVDRALEILLAFNAKDVELSAAELLERCDLTRPTLYRLLYTLEKKGFIQAVGEPQSFRLGTSVGKLAAVWSSNVDVAHVAAPILKKAWVETGETVALFVARGAMRLCVAELPSPQPISFKRGVGYTEHLVKGASGRAILAFTEEAREALSAFTKGTGVNTGDLERELDRTRRRGYAFSHNELIQGAVAVAAPFFYRSGEVAGSFGVFGPDFRCDEARVKKLGPQVIGYAKELSSALGA